MAKREILRYLIYFLSAPFIILSLVAEIFNLWDLNKDIKRCCESINDHNEVNIPLTLWYVLIIAEDRRSYYHKGIDPIAMIRAIYIKIIKNEVQGASTIEQQFVRVVSKRYEKKLSRKFREQILALCVSRRYSKFKIAKTYISIAFYGSGKIGLDGIKKLNNNIQNIEYESAISIVARLKYPEPLEIKDKKEWILKYSKRVKYLSGLLNKSENICFSIEPIKNSSHKIMMQNH